MKGVVGSVLLAALVGCSGSSGDGSTVAAGKFRQSVERMYAAVEEVKVAQPMDAAAQLDGFADAVSALKAPANEAAAKGRVISAAHSEAAAYRAYQAYPDGTPNLTRLAPAIQALRAAVQALP